MKQYIMAIIMLDVVLDYKPLLYKERSMSLLLLFIIINLLYYVLKMFLFCFRFVCGVPAWRFIM